MENKKISHPAKYSDILLKYFNDILPSDDNLILDPFAGTGKLRQIRPSAILLEIEPEWAQLAGAIVGDATKMPFCNEYFDAICTSPTYGNRMADNFIDKKPEKKYIRNTYRHKLGRELSENNSGKMQFGESYRNLHVKAWEECYRVLKKDGLFVINISDHIRKGNVVKVSDWHFDALIDIGFFNIDHFTVKTKRNGFGSNRERRVDHENIYVFIKG